MIKIIQIFRRSALLRPPLALTWALKFGSLAKINSQSAAGSCVRVHWLMAGFKLNVAKLYEHSCDHLSSVLIIAPV